jgi:hypothetical protein
MALPRNPAAAFLRSRFYRDRVLAPEIRCSDRITAALGLIRNRWPETAQNAEDTESPIFILSAGWGSGSTLLQRLVSTDSSVLLWGEPHDHAVPVHRLAQTLMPISDRWPKDSYFSPDDSNKPLYQRWIANHSPEMAYFKDAHRAFLETWLRQSAGRQHKARWGLKEVRLTIDHARYLRWLFPGARFLFIYRDVMSSYRSCKNVRWLSVWPDYRVSPAGAFAHHWLHLLTGFLAGADDVGGMVIRYENLIADAASIREMTTYLGLSSIDKTLLTDKVGERGSRNAELTAREKFVIQSITGELRDRLGYQ